ncbi:DISARM system helicase DrmA [Streptomyces sp. B21-083]|uniref:DISARM system helicase DrmA n=1 Tax=Streptomyces sp. B21-083 TaxID=3039410 RepID=UPI002FEF544D
MAQESFETQSPSSSAAAAGTSDVSVLTLPRPQEIRSELEQLVVRDLLGPIGDQNEELSDSPVDQYVIGRLAPNGSTVEPDQLDALADAEPQALEEGDREPDAPNVPSLQPSAIGFTICLDGDATELTVAASWARYERVPAPEHERAASVWRRTPVLGTAAIKISEGEILPQSLNSEQPQIMVRGRTRRFQGDWLISLFLVNAQLDMPGPKNWIFQAELEVHGTEGEAPFKPRQSQVSGGGDPSDQGEQRALAMAYRFHPEFAVGHGTGVHAVRARHDRLRASAIRTVAAPAYEVPFTDVPSYTHPADSDLPELAGLVLDMKELAELTPDQLRSALMPLVDGYRAWIGRCEARIDDPEQRLEGFAADARDNLRRATRAASRIEDGINLLTTGPALEAFRFANRAMRDQRVHSMAAAIRRRNDNIDLESAVSAVDLPKNRSWRPFQLAFVLLNLPALADPGHPERAEEATSAIADLLWFPTGGGKTEAYLGLTAFTLAIRRLRPDLGGIDARNGVAVLMRYTLRLLTIQQFQRAAALICACEVLRRQDTGVWGEQPFRLGLWVGSGVTPNRTDQADDWLTSLRRSQGRPARAQGSPHQLTSCPWCGSQIVPGRDVSVDLTTRRTVITCPELFNCPFGAMSDSSSGGQGLPVLVVDEEIYRLLPSVIIATVDKFAQLPWKGETQALFGQVTQRCSRHGYVTKDLASAEWEKPSHDAKGVHPSASTTPALRVRPPDLIIQDELHLISGPLGSLVGLYESAVDKLSTWEIVPGKSVRPKVIASTATVRRADRQIHSLFNRRTEVFPPPGLEASDNFFARQRDTQDQEATETRPAITGVPGRRYVGICAQGVRTKSTLIRIYVAVLGAAQLIHEKYGQNEITDPYMTLVGYFNSLRDLGGMRRLVEDDVTTRLGRADQRGLAKRYDPLLRELTSRMSSDDIPEVLEQLDLTFRPRSPKKSGGTTSRRPIDVLLATNMIAVGVDVSRLGVMVVTNQPKSTAEYIQATSRVGRASPGLVFTVLNWVRPRDLSHYETFESFHATIYRHVEALSVTPFADRAVDRGLSGVLVALVRNLEQQYNGNTGAQQFDTRGKLSDHVSGYLSRRARDVAAARPVGDEVRRQLDSRLDHWDRMRKQPATVLGYRKPYRIQDDMIGLLHEPDGGPWRAMSCPTSLREVEPGIRLILHTGPSGEEADEPAFQPRVDDPETSHPQQLGGAIADEEN